MANGDIDYTDVQEFLKLGREFPATSTNPGVMIQADVTAICDDINSEVNLWLKRLGFGLPLGVTDNINWSHRTKLFGAGSLVLDGIMAQDTEEGNTRAQRFWRTYEKRMQMLYESGGDILDGADKQTDPRPVNTPYLAGDTSEEGMKRYLRWPQRAAADQYTDETAINQSGASWRSVIGGF